MNYIQDVRGCSTGLSELRAISLRMATQYSEVDKSRNCLRSLQIPTFFTFKYSRLGLNWTFSERLSFQFRRPCPFSQPDRPEQHQLNHLGKESFFYQSTRFTLFQRAKTVSTVEHRQVDFHMTDESSPTDPSVPKKAVTTKKTPACSNFGPEEHMIPKCNQPGAECATGSEKQYKRSKCMTSRKRAQSELLQSESLQPKRSRVATPMSILPSDFDSNADTEDHVETKEAHKRPNTHEEHIEEMYWNPSNTWIFAVGVLKYDKPEIKTWPQQGRSDETLINVFRTRGVPSNQIIFLKDDQATHENIQQHIRSLKLAKPCDTLIFYYAGHGVRRLDGNRTCRLVTYDSESAWTVSSLFGDIRSNFRGRDVIYTADCCHSGALVDEVVRPRNNQGKRLAALTSAHVTSTSTGAWTFTDHLIHLFDGSPLLDLNGDGVVTFKEAAKHIMTQMALIHDQRAAYGISDEFPPDLVMAETNGTRGEEAEFIKGRFEDIWWTVQVLQREENKVFVNWLGMGRLSTTLKFQSSWIPVSDTRPIRQEPYPIGTKVQAEWKGIWLDAEVLKEENGLHLVHYHIFSHSDDEWVKMDRIRCQAHEQIQCLLCSST
jgi:hypothetical protein